MSAIRKFKKRLTDGQRSKRANKAKYYRICVLGKQVYNLCTTLSIFVFHNKNLFMIKCYRKKKIRY